jgi:uncharacterized membrane protein SirB2
VLVVIVVCSLVAIAVFISVSFFNIRFYEISSPLKDILALLTLIGMVVSGLIGAMLVFIFLGWLIEKIFGVKL